MVSEKLIVIWIKSSLMLFKLENSITHSNSSHKQFQKGTIRDSDVKVRTCETQVQLMNYSFFIIFHKIIFKFVNCSTARRNLSSRQLLGEKSRKNESSCLLKNAENREEFIETFSLCWNFLSLCFAAVDWCYGATSLKICFLA